MQVKQGENIMVTTSENLKVNNVKAKNVQGQQVDLLPLPNNIWSLPNLIPGVYLLDVIVDMSSSGILGVYETVMVILQPDQTPLPPSTVINQVSILIETPGPNATYPSPEPPTPCPPTAEGIEDCPPTDEPTPIPGPPTPECPDAGPEVCGEEPPPEEVPPDSDDDTDDTDDNGNDNENGEDGSNEEGDDNEDGGGISTVPPFG